MSKVDFLTANTAKLRRAFRSRNPSARKFRLFMVACCRLDGAAITNPDCHALVDLAEQEADGNVTPVALAHARKELFRWCEDQRPIHGPLLPVDKRWVSLWGAYQAATDQPTSPVYGFVKDADYRPLLADILGPPPKSVTFSPSWQTDTAVSLAKQMYESRDFSAMPILADALQDAGCDNDEVLNHCRDAQQVHVRGCWAVDLVLGKG